MRKHLLVITPPPHSNVCCVLCILVFLGFFTPSTDCEIICSEVNGCVGMTFIFTPIQDNYMTVCLWWMPARPSRQLYPHLLWTRCSLQQTKRVQHESAWLASLSAGIKGVRWLKALTSNFVPRHYYTCLLVKLSKCHGAFMPKCLLRNMALRTLAL